MSPTEVKSVTDFGGEGGVIVLLHGFLSSSRYWKQVQPYLTAAGYRVITIDLLGFGEAPKPSQSTYNYSEHVAHIDSALAQLNIDKPFVLIGHSMGALIAARFAILHPAKINSLILLHPPLYMDAAEARKTLRDTGRIYRFLLDSKYRRFGWALIKTFAFRVIGKHSRIAREGSMRNVIEVSEILGDLEKIETRTLVLIGMRDRPQYHINIRRARLSSFVTVITRNMSHHSPTEQPFDIQGTILDFVNQQNIIELTSTTI